MNDHPVIFYPLTVLFKRCKDLPGQWTAHCLEIDVMTMGMSLSHAVGMVIEACGMVLEHDLGIHRDPLLRRAPDEFWDEAAAVTEDGEPITMTEVLSNRKHMKALTLKMVLGLDQRYRVETQEFSSPVAEMAEVAILR